MIFNLLGTIGVCVVLPLYWMVVVRKILILWPFLWSVGCLRGFKMGGFSPDWGDAGFLAALLILILISIYIFYRIEKTRFQEYSMAIINYTLYICP